MENQTNNPSDYAEKEEFKTEDTESTPVRTYSVEETTEEIEKAVTVKQWLLFWLVSLINIIPVIGFICYIIFIIYVAFKGDKRFPISMQNFCKAYLIVIAVGVVLAVVFAGSILGSLMSLGL